MAPALPGRPDLHADQREAEHPGDAADEREQREAPERHARDAGGQRDERPDHRNAAADEHRDLAASLEPALGALQSSGRHVDEAPVPRDERTSSRVADRPRDPAAEDVSEHAGADRREQAHAVQRDEVAGEQLDHLARHRDAGRLERHQAEHGGKAVVADQPGDRVDEAVEHEQARVFGSQPERRLTGLGNGRTRVHEPERLLNGTGENRTPARY